ncbi:reverse transcriptase domain-containing protein [Tanacetum coccineum]
MENVITSYRQGRREHEEMGAFIREFKTTNELQLKERNNSLSELEFEVYRLSKAINNAQSSNYEVKGVTTIEGKTTTKISRDANNVNKEPPILHHDKPVEQMNFLVETKLKRQKIKTISHQNTINSFPHSANEIDEKRLVLKDLPSHLEYAYLKGDESCPVIISSKLTRKEKISLLQVLEKRKGAISWKMSDIKGISPSFCTHKILMEESFKPVIQPQQHLNPKVQDVVKNKIVKILDSGLIYPISDSPRVSPIHVVPKKGEMTVVLNDNNELIPSRIVTGWRVCIDYRKLNDAMRKDHFPLLFIDQMLERLSGNEYYCFLDGFSGFFQIPITPEDQEKMTFICLYGTLAYRRMPFGLRNAPATFQRCMTAIFHDMVEDFMEVFMDDFSVFGNSFDQCLNNLDKMLGRCKETNCAKLGKMPFYGKLV